jgi:hypothetical protein
VVPRTRRVVVRRIVVLVADRPSIRTDEGGPAMYATIHRFRRWPDEETEEWGRALCASLRNGSQPSGSCVLGRLDGMDGAVLTLWDDEPSAVVAAARTGEGARWLDASVYAVVRTEPGHDRGETPRFAQLVWLNGAGDAGRADDAIRAGRERIAPALRGVDGVVCTYVLRADDHRMVAVTLVTSVEIPEELRRVVLATELLPWEDPARMTDPDRIDIDRVLVAELPAHIPTGVRS